MTNKQKHYEHTDHKEILIRWLKNCNISFLMHTHIRIMVILQHNRKSFGEGNVFGIINNHFSTHKSSSSNVVNISLALWKLERFSRF